MILVCEVLYDSLTGHFPYLWLRWYLPMRGWGEGLNILTTDTVYMIDVYLKLFFAFELCVVFIRWKTDCTYFNFIVPFSFIRTSATFLNPLVQLATPPPPSQHIYHNCSCVAGVACGFIHAFSVYHRAKLNTYFKQIVIRCSSSYTCML